MKQYFDFKNYLTREAESVAWLNDKEYEIVVGGGAKVKGDRFDYAASRIINNTKFNVFKEGDSIRMRIVEFFGERIEDFSSETDEQFKDDVEENYGKVYSELLGILNTCFMMYSANGYDFSPESFKEFVRNTFKPLSMMPRMTSDIQSSIQYLYL